MAYDAGSAVGTLRLDATQWNRTIEEAKKQLATIRGPLIAITRALQFSAKRMGTQIEKEAAAARVAQTKAAQLAQKAEIAASLIATRGRVRQETAIAVDAAKTQSRLTLMEAAAGHKAAAREAAESARRHVVSFATIQRAGTRAFNAIGTAMTRVRYGAQLVATTFVAMAGVITWQLYKILGGFAEFEQRMRKATSVTKATEMQYREMTKEAETAATKWGTPASDTADAFLYLGRAGLTAEQQLAAMPAVTAASKAMLEDLEQTTEGVVNVMNAFNLSYSETPHVADMMTEAVNSSTMNLHEFLVSLSYAAKPAAAFNNTLEDTAAMIGIAANAGIRGSKAGTALRYSLTQLAAPTAAMKKLMRELHIEVYDANGVMRPLVDIIEEVASKTEVAGEEMRNYALKTLFGQRALSTMIALFDTGADGIRRYSAQIRDASGVTEKTAQKQMVAMKSILERLRETWEMLRRHVVEKVAPDINHAVEVVRGYMEKWTKTVDENGEAVRAFMGDLVKMLTTFAKITAGAAAFAVVTRVIGGLVMILQALFSPLGVAVALLFTLQTAWNNNFLHMRDVGHAVFDFLTKDAAGFFVSLINGMGKATAYVINSIAKWGQRTNITGLKANIIATLNAKRTGDTVSEQLQHEIYQVLTDNGKKTLEQGVEDALYNSRSLYESAKWYWTQKGSTQIGSPEFLQELKTQVLWAQDHAEATIKDVLTIDKAPIDVITGQVKGIGDAFAKTFSADIDFVMEKLKGMMPQPLLDALKEVQKMLDDINKKAEIPITTESRGKLAAPWSGYRVFDQEKMYKEWLYGPNSPILWNRIKAVYRDVADDFSKNWKDAIVVVMNAFEAMSTIMITQLNNIRTTMADSFDSLMRKGGSLVRFMDSVFQSILDGFRRLLAEMMANSLFDAMFGTKEGRASMGAYTGADMSGIISGIGSILGLSWGGGGVREVGALESPIKTLTAGETAGYEMESPKIALNVTNNGAPVALKQVGGVVRNGRQVVINYVMEEAESNPRFREVLAGGY